MERLRLPLLWGPDHNNISQHEIESSGELLVEGDAIESKLQSWSVSMF